MQVERWQKIEDIFNAAVKLPSHERETFVCENCGGDVDLRRDIINLLSENEKSDDFLSQPVFSLGAQLLDGEFQALLDTDEFGHYRLEKLLGRGGVGAVFVAEDSRLGRKVALKILPSILEETDERVLRFQQEGRTASAVSHPNIAHIYEHGSFKGHYFLAMEYIEGQTLRQYLRNNHCDLSFTLKTVSQLAKALGAAHRAGIIHRDIKPENIMITEDKIIKVLDFGLAKPISAVSSVAGAGGRNRKIFDSSLITMPGLIIGTAAYMSPEQARADELNGATDVWSLGVVFFEMLAGSHPFHQDSNIETLHSILKEQPKNADRLEKNYAPLLTGIVLKCLEKKREDRFQTMEAFLSELNKVAAPSGDAAESLKKEKFMRLVWQWVGIMLLALLIGAGIQYFFGG